MSIFERLLVPGSTEKPECRCGDVMEVVNIERGFRREAMQLFAYISVGHAATRCG